MLSAPLSRGPGHAVDGCRAHFPVEHICHLRGCNRSHTISHPPVKSNSIAPASCSLRSTVEIPGLRQ